MNVNKVFFGGRLTARPELRTTQGGTQVARFSIASSSGTGDRKETCYMDVVAFGATAGLCASRLDKGSGVFVEGRIRQEEWTDRQGQKRKAVRIVADCVQFIDPARHGDTGTAEGMENPYL